MTVTGEIEKRAMRNFYLAMDRAGQQCPWWARRWTVAKHTLAIYKRSAIKNRFKSAYGKMGEPYHVDHIIPLHGENVSGLHVPWNLHVIPAIVNQCKGVMIVEEYLDRGRFPTFIPAEVRKIVTSSASVRGPLS